MKRRAAFTLIELVVIIMILGILAGVAAPKLLKTSGNATDNGLKQSLSIIRDAIELYAADNGGALPACTSTGADFRAALCPQYIRGTFPLSPVGLKDFNVKPTTGLTTTADNSTGWMFNTTNGTFICNCTTTSTTAGVTYNQF